MYTDFDSILFSSQEGKAKCTDRWVSQIDAAVLSREDLCLLYGCWAEDAAHSAFLAPVDGKPSLRIAYAA